MEFLFGGSSDRNKFTTFVLSNSPHTVASLREIGTELAGNPTAAGELLQSEECCALFLSDFSERLERILVWLNSLPQPAKPQPKSSTPLADTIQGFAVNLVLPLLNPTYSDYHGSRGFADLLITTTQLSYLFSKRGYGLKIHKVLLEKISQTPQLMHSIISSIDGAKLVQMILQQAQAGAEVQAFPSAAVLTEWATAAADLCSGCPGKHGAQAELGRWESLVELRDSLTRILVEENERRINYSRMNMKPGQLSEYLSSRDIENLEVFGMRAPTGIGPLEGALARLRERESFSLLHALVKTFPCALCLRRCHATHSVSLPTLRRGVRKPLSTDDLPISFTSTLLGQRLGPWRVCLSERAFKDLLSADKEGYLNIIARRLRELATGQWEPKSIRLPLSQKMLEECQESMRVPLWRATYGSNGRILWQVNVAYDEEVAAESQMITVWRIGKSDEVRGSISQVLYAQKSYTESHIQRCCVSLQDFPLSPQEYYAYGGDITPEKPTDTHADTAAQGDFSNKFYPMTVKVLDCLFSDPDRTEFPFEISREEMDIVKHSNSAAFILGRSGTGKTTCLLFKLLCRNIASRAQDKETPVRQIFLTRSSFLAERLNDYLARLMESQLGKFSARTGVEHSAPQEYMLKEACDPLEDETLETLHDDKFPLVCTFDQLFGFLERSIALFDRNNFNSQGAYGFGNTPWAPPPSWGGRVRRLINYNVFSTQYCRKSYQDRKSGFESDLVFAEILGIIKGSTSIERDFKPLSREEYVGMSTRIAPVFTDEASRDRVYSMYEEYERHKGSLGDRDDIDRVIKVLKSLEEQPELMRQVQALFDEVYVDEVQDNKLLEIRLLFTLVQNPHGIHFAGDTAQCISRDNTFRFEDIKARFYEHFLVMARNAGKIEWAKPNLFPLAKNYRSHQGILSLAADIVDMLCNGFPGQIDVLPREIGNSPGAKPTMFLGFDHKILAQGNAGVPGTEQGLSGFGAEQVIIVKNEDIKEGLKKVLPQTLILTIYQSKGLEFEDVVLYNFFSDSIWDNIRLRTLELLVTREELDRRWQLDRGGELDRRKYGGLCSELKHLYVAVTRARKNLWIVESNKSSVTSIVALWTKSEQGRIPLVSIVDIDEPEANAKAKFIMKPGKSTSPEAWRKQGEMLLQRALYEDALFCFRRAGYKQGEDVANAYLLYEEASALGLGEGTHQARVIFARAAQLFEQALFIQKAAETWGAAGRYRNAADILKTHREYGKAALWYARVPDFMEAAECHHLAKQYDEAVIAYRKGEHFTELVTYLGDYSQCISNGVKTRYSMLVNILLQRGDLPEALLPTALKTLGSEDAKEDFYKKFERTDDLLAFYTAHKRYQDFFQLALSKGKFEDAVHMANKSRATDPGSDSAVPAADLLTLFNGLMAGHTWSSIRFDLHKLSGTRVLPTFKKSNHAIVMLGGRTALELRSPSSGWEEILDCLRSIDSGDLHVPRQRHNVSHANFFKGFGDDFLDLVEFLHSDTTLRDKIPHITDVNQLPVATMQKFATIAGDLLSRRIPPATLVASIGVLVFSHLEGRAVVLPWSPLFPMAAVPQNQPQDGSHVILTREQAYECLTEWLVTIVARIIPCTLLQLRSLLVETQGLCFRALQGSCRTPDKPSCKLRRHTRLPPEELRTYIFSLLDAAELSCASARLYHHRKFQEDDSKSYLGNKRALLERTLEELTFLSPLLNDSGLQQEVWEKVWQRNGTWPHVRDGLAGLFFYRLRPEEWEKRGTLSALLEERSFASRLGVMPRFLGFLWDKDQGRVNFTQSCNDLQPAKLAWCGVPTLVNHIGRITSWIFQQLPWELQSFHTVLSLCECLSLELINRALRLDLLVPRSRLHFIRDLSQASYPTAEERHNLECCLIQLLSGFCDILVAFSEVYRAQRSYPKQPNTILFKACGKNLRDGDRYMVRRSLDHLALCMVNMGVGRATMLPTGYNQLRKKIQETYEAWNILNPPTPISLSGPFTADQIAIQLANVYRTYNKDELVIVGSTRSKGARFGFLSGSPLRRVVWGEHNRAPALDPLTSSESPSVVQTPEQSGEETAASKIAHWWRRCSSRLKARLAYTKKQADKRSQGPEGQAEVIIDDIIVHWMSSKYRQQRNIVRDSGAPLLTCILKLQGLAKATYTKSMSGLTDTTGKYRLSSVAVEDIQDMVALLEKRKHLLAQSEAMFSNPEKVEVLFKLSGAELEDRMSKALEVLEAYQKEIEKWTRDIKDCLEDAKRF